MIISFNNFIFFFQVPKVLGWMLGVLSSASLHFLNMMEKKVLWLHKCMCVHDVCMYKSTCVEEHMDSHECIEKSEDNFMETFLSFYHVGSRDQT